MHVGAHREPEDVAGHDQFFVDDRVDAHVLGQVDIVEVLHFGDYLFYAEAFGQHCRQDIGFGAPGDGQESVHVAEALFDHGVGIASVLVDD